MSTFSPNPDPPVELQAATPFKPEPILANSPTASLFRNCLLENLRDGIVYVDSKQQILTWSHTLELMTGMCLSQVDGVKLTPSLLGLSDEIGDAIDDANDPLTICLTTRKKSSGDYKLIGRSGREVKVDITYIPVIDANSQVHGAVVMIHDTSVQLDLQRQLRDLYEFSMLDPLTQVANRAEFERVLDEFVRARNLSDFQCSLIVCDIDFFKQINDNYNHHIGDQALVSFAGLLKKFVRSQDVVARYGGEEFVILCANCDVDSAVQRAEEIRVTLTKTPQQMIDGKCITASFGVAELMVGDSPTDFFVRADTALLHAKELGRNRVVEASAAVYGASPELTSAELTSLAGVAWRKVKGKILLSEEYSTSTPLTLLVEKLRGYIIETEAEIRRVESDFASLIVEYEDEETFTRKGKFTVDVEFHERERERDNKSFGTKTETCIRISVREAKRNWFATNAIELAPNLVSDMRRYLMINDESCKLNVTPAATQSNGR